MEEKIIMSPKYWDVADVYSVKAVVKAATSNGATGALKKGTPVFANPTGGYQAYALTSVKTGTTAVGVLMEDIEDISANPTVRVMYAGKAYIEGVRAAGVTEANASDEALMALNGHIVFVKEKEVGYGN